MRNKFIILISGLLAASTFAGCGAGQAVPVPTEEPLPEPLPPVYSTVFMNPLEPPEDSGLIHDIPNLLYKIEEAYEINSDTVGWLQVPGANIDEVVVYRDDSATKPNDFYLRRNIEKDYSFDGICFADYRCTFDGTAEGLRRNTVLYGHSFNDNINGRLWNALKKYDPDLNPEGEQFTRDNPYIFFSVAGENRAWEIFSLFVVTTGLPYHIPTLDDAAFEHILEEGRERSFYNYPIEVSADDKILTLSTCVNKYDKRYPNSYRYVIMAKLVEDGEPLKQQAVFEYNEDRVEPRYTA